MKKKLFSVLLMLLCILTLCSCELTFNKRTTTKTAVKSSSETKTTITTKSTTKSSETVTTTTITVTPTSKITETSTTTTKISTTTTKISSTTKSSSSSSSSKSTTNKPIVPVENSEDIKSYLLYDGNYYDSVTSEMLNDSAVLKAELNRIVNTNYTRVSYNTAYDKLETVDMYDTEMIECIYTGLRMVADRTTAVWDREHIWAKSYGFKDESYDAYSDLHHLRVSEHMINVNRSSSYFTTVSNPDYTDEYGNRWTTLSFEPRDEVKGDIARMLIYMTVKYDNGDVLDLELTDDVALINTSASVFGGLKPDTTGMSESNKAEIDKRTYTQGPVYLGLLSELLRWSIEDPVDEREITRNNNIYAIQNNRNPFIDHPEYVYYIYKTEYESMNIEYNANNYNYYMLADKDAIATIDSHITALPEVITLQAKDQLEAIRTEYNALGQVTKSFVDKYSVFMTKEAEYNRLVEINNVDKTVSTSFDFTSATGTSGSYHSNSIDLSWASDTTASTGLGVTIDKNGNKKPCTITSSNLYDTIVGIKISWGANNCAGNGTITVTDKNGTSISATLNYPKKTTAKPSADVYVNISTLDFSGPLTIVINNNTRQETTKDGTTTYGANTIRIRAIEFVLSIPN
ncbi:MAG: endonuclease [Gammaproteobacteria bacterium]|nr:endonuclease [Gammaproteobacteria bacterium]